jgi:starch synthase
VGGIPEMIRDGATGWLVRPEAGPSEIGERIAQLFKDPDRMAQAGGAGRSFCAEHWSWDSVAKKALEPIAT